MSPLRRINKVWYSDIRIKGRGRVRVPLSTDKSVALLKLRDLEREQSEAKYAPAVNQIAWTDFKKKYLDYCLGAKAAGTAKRDRMAILSLEKFAKVRRLAEITPEVLETWKATRRRDGRGHATINRDLRAVKLMMKTAQQWGYIRGWDGSAVKRLRESEGRLLYYTPAELTRLLGNCRSRYTAFYDWETICLLGARAGLRRSEIHWLSWEDVDLKRGILTIAGKNGWSTKTGRIRHVPIPPDLQKHLAQKRTEKRTQWVLGERPSLAVMSAFFQKISRKSGLAGNIHTLRHTFASHLAQAGVPLHVIGELLGHTSPIQTKIYAHLSPVTLAAAVKRLPNL